MSEGKNSADLFATFGGDRTVLEREDTAHLLIDAETVVSARQVAGLSLVAEPTPLGVNARLRVAAGVRLAQPVHLCFGLAGERGEQRIVLDIRLEPGAAAMLKAHCFFPGARRVRHVMTAQVEVGEGAELRYEESHFHGPHGGVEVAPTTRVQVAAGGRYATEFSLTTGRVGTLDIDTEAVAAEDAVIEMTARVFGHATDRITIREAITLAGENARGLIKSRIALEHEASAEVTGITAGNAAGARGHVDCLEIVRDHAVARAVPVVSVTHPLAKVTHEAAIGSVDHRQLETLMSHGLSPEEAVDLIVRGMLK